MRLQGTFFVCLVLSVITLTRARTDAVKHNAACSAPTDICFLIDVSESIAPSDFQLQKQFVSDQVLTLDDPNRTVRTSIIPYSSHVKATIGLEPYKSPSHVAQLISEIPSNIERTDLATAFNHMTRVFREESRRSTRKLVVLFSGSRVKDFESAKQGALMARYIGVKLVTVGLGKEANMNQLNALAKDSKLTFHSKDMKDAAQLKETLTNIICPNCNLTTDVIVMLDGSEGIPSSVFENQKRFLQELIALVSKEHPKIRIGTILHSSTIKASSDLQPPKTFEQMVAITWSLTHPQEGVNFVSAFRGMRQIFEEENRPRSNRIGVVITDSRSKDFAAAKNESILAKTAGVKIIVIGIGEQVKKFELQEYASKVDMVFFPKSFKDLSKIKEPVQNLLCSDKTSPTEPSEFDWGQPWSVNMPMGQWSAPKNDSPISHQQVDQPHMHTHHLSTEPSITVNPLSNNAPVSTDHQFTTQNLLTAQPKSEERFVNTAKQSRNKSDTKPVLVQLPAVIEVPSRHFFTGSVGKHPGDKATARADLSQLRAMQPIGELFTESANANLNLWPDPSEPVQLHMKETHGFRNVEAKDAVKETQTVTDSVAAATTTTDIELLTVTIAPKKSSANDQTEGTTENVAELATANPTLAQEKTPSLAPLRTKFNEQRNRPSLIPLRKEANPRLPSRQNWIASLKLGEAENGGTNSPINIRLRDKEGFQDNVSLNEQGIPLKKGMVYSFRFSTGYLGNLSEVEIFLSVSQNPWHLETFQLSNVDTAQSYEFRIGSFSTKETFHVPQEKVKLWKIQIKVGDYKEAGSRGVIRVRFRGSKGISNVIQLRSPHHQEFIPGETVDFYLSTKDIGHFEWAQLIVGQWDLIYLESLLITDIDKAKNYTFSYSGFVMNETFYANKQNINKCEKFSCADRCIPFSYLCDGLVDCPNREDEAMCPKKSNDHVPLRLRGGSTQTEGRVELLLNGLWGGVCSRNWDDNDARVVCRMMGHKNGRAMSTFPAGTDLIWMDGVRCTGQETTIMQCDRAKFHSCEAKNAAGVSCYDTESKYPRENKFGDHTLGQLKIDSPHRLVPIAGVILQTESIFKGSHMTRTQPGTPWSFNLARENNGILDNNRPENVKQFAEQGVSDLNKNFPQTGELPHTVEAPSTFISSQVTSEQSFGPQSVNLGRETTMLPNQDTTENIKQFAEQGVSDLNKNFPQTGEFPHTAEAPSTFISSQVTSEQSFGPQSVTLGKETTMLPNQDTTENIKQFFPATENGFLNEAVSDFNIGELPHTTEAPSTSISSQVTSEQSVATQSVTLGRETTMLLNQDTTENMKQDLQATEKGFQDQSVSELNMNLLQSSSPQTGELPQTPQTPATSMPSQITSEHSVASQSVTLGSETTMLLNQDTTENIKQDLQSTGKGFMDQAFSKLNMNSLQSSSPETGELPHTAETPSTSMSSEVTSEQSVAPQSATLARETTVLLNQDTTENMKQGFRPTENSFSDHTVDTLIVNSPQPLAPQTGELPHPAAVLPTFISSHITSEQSTTFRPFALERETTVSLNKDSTENMKDVRPTEKGFNDQVVGELSTNTLHSLAPEAGESTSMGEAVSTLDSSHMTSEQSFTPQPFDLGRETSVSLGNSSTENTKQDVRLREKELRDQVVGVLSINYPQSLAPQAGESTTMEEAVSTLDSSHMTSEQSFTPQPFDLGRETSVALGNSSTENTKRVSPSDVTAANSRADIKVSAIKSTSTPSPTTMADITSKPTASTTTESAMTTVTTTETMPTTPPVTTTKARKTATTTPKPKLTFDSKQMVPMLSSRQQNSDVIKDKTKLSFSSKNTPPKTEAPEVDLWESVLGEVHHDFLGDVPTTRRSPFLDLAARKLQKNSGSAVKSDTAHIWEPGSTTSMYWGARREQKSKTSVRNKNKPENRPIMLNHSNKTPHSHIRPHSSNVSPTERSSSDTDVPIADIILTIPSAENSQTKETRVGLKSPLQNSHRSSRPVMVTHSNKNTYNLNRSLSSKVSPTEKSSSDTDVPIADIILTIPSAENSQTKETRVGLKSPLQNGHRSSRPVMITQPENRPIMLNHSNKTPHSHIRSHSSKVSPTERSSSDTVVPIADIILTIPSAGNSQTKEARVGLKSPSQNGQRTNAKKVAVKVPHRNIAGHHSRKTISVVPNVSTRSTSIVHPPFNIESVSNLKYPRPAEIDSRLGDRVISKGIQSQRNRGPNSEKSSVSSGNHVVNERMDTFNTVFASRKSIRVDQAAGEHWHQSASLTHFNQNSKTDHTRWEQHTSHISPGIKEPKSGSIRLPSFKEGFGIDHLKLVPAIESSGNNQPSPGRSVHRIKASDSNNNRRFFSPHSANERQKADRASPRQNDVAVQRPTLFNPHLNHVLQQSKVEQRPFEPTSIKELSGSVNVGPSVNSPRLEEPVSGLKTSNNDNLPDLGGINFRPALSQVSTVKPTPTEIFEKVEGCLLTPYEQDERYYLEEVLGFTYVIRPCPIGTVFRMRICTCTAPENGIQDSSLKCNIEFQLDFEYDLKDSSGKNLFSSSENVHLEHSAARFVGNSYISVWRFQEAEFGDKISIRLNFKQDGLRSEVQQLVGNCVIGSKPSVSISIDKQREIVIYSIMTYTDFKIIEAPYNCNDWNEVALAYDGKVMQGITNGIQKFKYLEGKIQKRGSPLKFGFCQTGHGFQGLLDSVQIYMCVPGQEAAATY